jgi:hypothetical protein
MEFHKNCAVLESPRPAIAKAPSVILPRRRANQFDQFAPIHLARPALDGAKSQTPKSKFRERIQSDAWLPSLDAKFLSENRKPWYLLRIPLL